MKTAPLLCLGLGLLLSQLLTGQTQSKPSTVSRKLFEVEKSVEDLRKEMAALRQQINEMEIRTSIPEIRKEINRLIQVPELSHEIMLKNGTIVKGKILHEDLDILVVQTQIGQLTISKKEIRETRPADLPKAKCVIDGAIKEEVHENKRVYRGRIKNEGIRRADFPRIAFYLYDETTNLVAADSVIVAGTYHMFLSGVQTDATIEPGQTFNFVCEVPVPPKKAIAYYVRKVAWEEFE